MNIFLSPSNIHWSSKDTRFMSKFYYYIYYLSFASFWSSDLLSFLLVCKKEIH